MKVNLHSGNVIQNLNKIGCFQFIFLLNALGKNFLVYTLVISISKNIQTLNRSNFSQLREKLNYFDLK